MAIVCKIFDSSLAESVTTERLSEGTISEIENIVRSIKSQVSEGKDENLEEGERIKILEKAKKIIGDAIQVIAEENDIEIPINLEEVIGKTWSERNTSRSDSSSNGYVDLNMTEVPNLTNGLFSIFKNDTDKTKFIRFGETRIVKALIVDDTTGKEISTDRQLNSSFENLQNRLAKRLSNFLGIQYSPIYDNGQFNANTFKELVDSARLYFYSSIEDGRYSFSTSVDRDNFYIYTILTNFDTFITNYLNDVINIRPDLIGVRNTLKGTVKYTYAKTHIKQLFDDEKAADASNNVNRLVQLYITTLEEINSNSEPTGNTLQFRDFNSLIRIIKEKKPRALDLLRDYPGEALKDIMDEIYGDIDRFFTGKDSILKNTFYTVYKNIFEGDFSLYGRNTANNSSSKNNLYSMIANHISKTTPVNYMQTTWDAENNQYVRKYLTSENLVIGKANLKRHLALHVAKGNYSDLYEQYDVQFVSSDSGIINTVKFKIGPFEYTVDFKNTSVPSGVNNIIQRFKQPDHMDFFNNILRYQFDEDFYNSLIVANSETPGAVYKLLNLAANILAANHLALQGITNKISLKNHFETGVLKDDKSNSWYNNITRGLNPEGFNGALDALDAVAKGQSLATKELTKSNVKNAEGNSLSKYRQTCLAECNRYLFSKNRRESTSDDPLYYNLFIPTKNYNLINTYFKTDFTNYEGTSKQIKSMTKQELLYDQFLGYIGSRRAASDNSKATNIRYVEIQPDVYADKSTIIGLAIDIITKFSYTSKDGVKIIDNKNFAELTSKELADLYYHTLRNQFSLLQRNIMKDYDTLFTELNTLYPNLKLKTGLTNFLEYSKELAKLGKNSTVGNKLIYEGIRSANNKGIKLNVAPEIHFVWNKKAKAFQLNNTLLMYFSMFCQNDRKNFDKKNYIEEVVYAESLRAAGVRFETKLQNGLNNAIILENIDQSADQTEYFTDKLGSEFASKILRSGSTYGDIWINKATQSLVNYLLIDKKSGEIIDDSTINLTENMDDYIVVINPEMQRFKLLDNVVSNNFNLATTGAPFLHPTKKAFAAVNDWNNITDQEWVSLKREEAERTVAMNKRGVIFGGTGHPFIKNKIDGIPQQMNIAVIQDLVSKNMGITGDNDEATQYDGAILGNPFFYKWAANSLSEMVLSSTHMKPLGFNNMGEYLSSMLLKCATFAITNAAVRSSLTGKVSLEVMMRNMTDIPWVVPNLNLAPYFTSVFYWNPDTFKFYKISSLRKIKADVINGKVDNTYTAVITEVTENGTETTNKETREFHINSNYDLWKVLGGCYSCSLINGKLQESEASVDLVADIANKTNIYSNSDEITEYNKFIEDGLLQGEKLEINPDLRPTSRMDNNKKIPENYLKFTQSKVYFQPMKYSDVHYLANSSAVKNGMTNINPASIYYNSTDIRINLTDKWIFAYPTTGKTQASNMGYNIISFDDVYSKDLEAYRNATDEITKGQLRGKLFQDIAEVSKANKQVYFSDPEILEMLLHSNRKLDKIVSLSLEDYIQREKNRGSKLSDEEIINKYNAITNSIASTFPNVETIDATGHNLYEYLGSNLIATQFDPDYLVIQLNAEHNIEDDEVSEMTQVISAMEQGTFSHLLAMQIYTNIGRTISNKLSIYKKYNVNTEKGREELNKILGRALVRIFNNEENTISLASAYLDNIRAELANSENPEIKAIPFDDNNILGAFETNFKNGFNKDIIKRHFPGLAAVLNPSQDMYSVYEYNGKAITSQDFRHLGKGFNSKEEFLKSLDVDVLPSQIETGDWIEVNGVPYQVGTINTADEGEITLYDIRNNPEYWNEDGTIRKLGSKGRNLRAQNYKFTVNPTAINREDNNFDQYDLDSALLSHKLHSYLNGEVDETTKAYLDQVFSEVEETVHQYYTHAALQSMRDKRDEDGLRPYIKFAIQKDLENLQNGNFKIPIRFRANSEVTTNVLTSEYTPNEIAIGKPFANKYLLDPGDTLNDITPQFFKDKLIKRRESPIDKQYYDLNFVGNNYILHFTNDKRIIDRLREKYEVQTVNVAEQTIATPDGLIRQVNENISYPINPNTKFYRITMEDGKTVEFAVGYNRNDLTNIWETENFYTNNFNFSNYTERDLDKNIKKLTSLLINFAKLNNTKIKTEITPENILETVNKFTSINLDVDKLAQRMYQSFNESLKLIAARIPAQSMQSFMNMKIVGFLETDTNIAYVPLQMLVYEGSDFKLKFLV